MFPADTESALRSIDLNNLLRQTRRELGSAQMDSKVLEFKYKNFNLAALEKLQVEAEAILDRIKLKYAYLPQRNASNG
jgi:hypothetical protein